MHCMVLNPPLALVPINVLVCSQPCIQYSAQNCGCQREIGYGGTISDWYVFDTRHTVFRPMRLTAEQLETGSWRAYRDFYRWGSIFQSAGAHPKTMNQLRHIAYSGGWKKFEPMWDWIIRAKRAANMLPVLETVLAGFKFSLCREECCENIYSIYE